MDLSRSTDEGGGVNVVEEKDLILEEMSTYTDIGFSRHDIEFL